MTGSRACKISIALTITTCHTAVFCRKEVNSQSVTQHKLVRKPSVKLITWYRKVKDDKHRLSYPWTNTKYCDTPWNTRLLSFTQSSGLLFRGAEDGGLVLGFSLAAALPVFRFLITGEYNNLPLVLWHCWLGNRKGIQPAKKLVLGGGDLTAALHILRVPFCITAITLAALNSQYDLPFWYWLTHVVLENWKRS